MKTKYMYVVMIIEGNRYKPTGHSNERIFDNWSEAKAYRDTPEMISLSKEKDNSIVYKKFTTKEDAERWIQYNTKPPVIIDETGIFFDSGTGGDKGTRVNVTSFDKTRLAVHFPEDAIYDDDGLMILPDKTNNYGELYALKLAVEYALEHDIKNIYGDSKLVIFYWSMGKYNEANMTKMDTIELIKETSAIRRKFYEAGGRVTYISGDLNPADLGYHKTK